MQLDSLLERKDIPSDVRQALKRDITERINAEEALRESEERLRAFIDSATDAFSLWDSELNLITVNEAGMQMIPPEIKKKGAIGTNLVEFDYTRARGTFDKYMNVMKTGKPYIVEDSVPHPIYGEKYFNIKAFKVGSGMGMIITDITERKRAEEVIRKSEKKYRRLTENISDVVLEVDSEGKLIYISPQVFNLLGYQSNELMGIQGFDFIHPDDLETALKVMAETENLKDRIGVEYRAQHKDGHYIPIFGSIRRIQEGDDFKLIGVFRDISELKKAEESLKESEQKFRLLSEQSMLGITILQDGLIKYVNNALAEMIEYTPEEMLKWSVDEWVTAMHPEDRSIAIEQARKKQAGKTDVIIQSSFRLIAKTGKTKWVENYSKTIIYEGKTADFITLIDITDRKQTEEALRESEEQLRAFMDSATDAFSLWDSELNLIDINKAGMEMIPAEIKGEGVIGKNLTDFGPIAKESGNFDRYMEVIRTGKPLFIENVVTDPTFGNIYVDVKAFKVSDGMGMIVTDITKRKQAEKALRESEKKYRTILESIEDGYYEVDLAGSLTFFNDSLCKFLGYSKDELMGMNYRQYMDDETAKQVYQTFNTVYKTRRPTKASGWEIISKDGTMRFNEASVSLIIGSSGEAVGFRGIVRDITERKEMEEALRESEERYRRLIDNLSDIVVETDSQGEFTFVSPQAFNLLGYQPEEVIGKNAFEFIHPDDLKNALDYMEKALRGEHVFGFEYRAQHKDGYYVWVSASGRIVEEDDKLKLILLIADINKRKQAEEELRVSEETSRNIIESIPLGMHMYQLEDDGNLIFVGANQAADEILGIDHEQLAGKKIEDAFPYSIETEIPDHYRAAAAEGTIWRNEDVIYEDERIKGAYDVCAFQTSPGKMVASFLDITERKKTEESLKESERKYRTLITTMTDGIVVTDVFNRLILVNPALENMLGYREDEMLNHLLIEFLDPDSIEIFKEKTKQRHSGLVPSEEYELIFTRKDGTKVTTRVAAKILMEGSQISGSFAVISDITKERELEQRRTSFMSMTAHELRTPTTIIRGYAELLETFFSDLGLDESEKFAIPLQKINKNVQRLERLISDVRDIMRIDRGIFQLQKEPVIINELLDEFLGSYKVILKDQLEYSISYIDTPIRIESDPVRLLQVFGNLIQNSIDHTSKDNRQITVSSTITSEDIVIVFSDNGAGIEPQYLEKIFEPFVSLPTEFTVQGTGVGLYLSRYIMEAHDGTLLASSKGKGFGATFTVRLPRN